MIVVLELDWTTIVTLSGENYPVYIGDFQLNFPVLERLQKGVQKGCITSIWIVSNQGGIASGKQDEELFKKKIEFISAAITDYCGCPCRSIYCKDLFGEFRLPEPGMFNTIIEQEHVKKEELLCICGGVTPGGNVMKSCYEGAVGFGLRTIKVGDFAK